MKRRPGRTVKLSISLDERDAELLRKRAEKRSGGNLSAVIAEMIRLTREWEGRLALAEWLGAGREEPSEETLAGVRAEWRGDARPKRRKRTAA
jgi:hypothetical protein